MVKKQKEDITKKPISKEDYKKSEEARKISASTHYETCSEQLSPFGGALALIKFLDLIKFEEVFKNTYHRPSREPKLGNYKMVVGIVMLIWGLTESKRMGRIKTRRFNASNWWSRRKYLDNGCD